MSRVRERLDLSCFISHNRTLRIHNFCIQSAHAFKILFETISQTQPSNLTGGGRQKWTKERNQARQPLSDHLTMSHKNPDYKSTWYWQKKVAYCYGLWFYWVFGIITWPLFCPCFAFLRTTYFCLNHTINVFTNKV